MPAGVFTLRCKRVGDPIKPHLVTPTPFCPHWFERLMLEGADLGGSFPLGWRPVFDYAASVKLRIEVLALVTRHAHAQMKRASGPLAVTSLPGRVKSDKAGSATPR